MKNHIAIHTVVAALLAASTLQAQVEIPIGEITVQQPVVVTQNVTLTAVPVTAIRFDIPAQRIEFTIANPAGGNRTVTIEGAAYQSISQRFLEPFSSAIAPALRSRLQADP